MYLSKNSRNNNDDGEDFEALDTLNNTSKLAAIFSNESVTKSSQSLEYVAPKQPSRNSNESIYQQSVETSHKKPIAIIFASPADLFQYHGGEVCNEGRVMCSIIQKKDKQKFMLYVYRTKINFIAQICINYRFEIQVQNNNYLTFTDEEGRRWSIHLVTEKYEEFLLLITLCRSVDAFSYVDPPLFVKQMVYEEETSSHALQKSDESLVSFKSWKVKDFRREKMEISESKNVKVEIDSKFSWTLGLLNCRKDQRCIICVHDNKGMPCTLSGGLSLFTIYEVEIKEIVTNEAPLSSIQIKKEELTPELKLPMKDEEKKQKSSILSRVAKIGQPMLPILLKEQLPLTDSDNESEYHQEEKPNIPSRPLSSISSLTEDEINRASSIPISDVGFTGPPSHIGPQFVPLSYGPQAPVASLMTYNAYGFKHQQESHVSESLLSLLLSESRSQNTDLRVSLSQLIQKVDMIYSQLNPVGVSSQFQPVMLRTLGANSSNPRELLNQITIMVERFESSENEAKILERKLQQMTENYTDILSQNKRLLEDKVQLLDNISKTTKQGETDDEDKRQSKAKLMNLEKENHDLQNKVFRYKEIIEKCERTNVELHERIKKDNEENERNNMELQDSLSKSHEEKAECERRMKQMMERIKELEERIIERKVNNGSENNNEQIIGTELEVDSVVKKIMNAVFKKSKSAFVKGEQYEKEAILNLILKAIKDTTLQYLDEREHSKASSTEAVGEEERKKLTTIIQTSLHSNLGSLNNVTLPSIDPSNSFISGSCDSSDVVLMDSSAVSDGVVSTDKEKLPDNTEHSITSDDGHLGSIYSSEDKSMPCSDEFYDSVSHQNQLCDVVDVLPDDGDKVLHFSQNKASSFVVGESLSASKNEKNSNSSEGRNVLESHNGGDKESVLQNETPSPRIASDSDQLNSDHTRSSVEEKTDESTESLESQDVQQKTEELTESLESQDVQQKTEELTESLGIRKAVEDLNTSMKEQSERPPLPLAPPLFSDSEDDDDWLS